MAIFYLSGGFKFVLDDKPLPGGMLELCSPYANLCFNRPASWTRSENLHVNGDPSDTIEINPPSGIFLELAKISIYNSEKCEGSGYDSCIILTDSITPIDNKLNVVTGTLIKKGQDSCENATTSCIVTTYNPFVRLVSTDDIVKYGLVAGKEVVYTSFNPGVKIGQTASEVFLAVFPGKKFDQASAQKWLNSDEKSTAQQILASTHKYQ